VLQPLDLGTFSSVKGKYRRRIAELSYLDDAAPIKKRRFVQCYNQARQESFTPSVLKSGWKAAGLFPWNPSKGINSSQVRIQPPATKSTTPPSPKQPQFNPETLLSTPKHPQHMYHAIQMLNRQQELSRDQRTVLQKAGKAIGQLKAQQAIQEALIHKQEAHLETLRSQKAKKKVAVDPNNRFANIEMIKKAMDEAKEQEARIQARQPEIEAKKASDAALNATFQNCIFEWQAY
jgi:hypothetical protein